MIITTNNQDQDEKHKYKRIETVKSPAGLFHPAKMRIVLLCSECGDIKVVDL